MPDTTTNSREYHNPIHRIQPNVMGVALSLRCPECNTDFEVYQPTIAGLPFADHNCRECHIAVQIGPDELLSAMETLLPRWTTSDMVRLTNEASKLTSGWHQVDPFRSAVQHRGINLGEAAERFLLAQFTLGVLEAYRSNPDIAAQPTNSAHTVDPIEASS